MWTRCPDCPSLHCGHSADILSRLSRIGWATFLFMEELVAAICGNDIEAARRLLKEIPWNSFYENKTLGEYAQTPEMYEFLLMEAVRSEFILKATGLSFQNEQMVLGQVDCSNSDYLASKLHFTNGKLLDSSGNAVMMGWESKLMQLHADSIKSNRVLNVGFGLGIIDSFIQKHAPVSHTIIEAHPDVYNKMIQDGWDKLPGVRIIFGRWQDVLDQLELYDGIFFDTFGEYYDDLKQFNDHVPNILDQNGVYSYFNGLAGTNKFFHDVACRMAEIDFNECGMSIEYQVIKMDQLGDETWQGTRRAYWSLDEYRLPIVRFISS
jgi:protein arginine N-methyltransferase 2